MNVSKRRLGNLAGCSSPGQVPQPKLPKKYKIGDLATGKVPQPNLPKKYEIGGPGYWSGSSTQQSSQKIWDWEPGYSWARHNNNNSDLSSTLSQLDCVHKLIDQTRSDLKLCIGKQGCTVQRDLGTCVLGTIQHVIIVVASVGCCIFGALQHSYCILLSFLHIFILSAFFSLSMSCVRYHNIYIT